MLAREIATLSDKIQFENHNFVLERGLADKYRIERTPALVVEGARDYGIRFYGIPAGFEFASLLEAIKMVSAGQSELSPFIREQLRTLTLPLDIKVFVTPTCPYCPTQVHLAHRMAMASDLITASMVESAEFPEARGSVQSAGRAQDRGQQHDSVRGRDARRRVRLAAVPDARGQDPAAAPGRASGHESRDRFQTPGHQTE